MARWLELYINISLQIQELTVSLLQLISYAQLHWTHTKKLEIVIEKSARREVTTVQLLNTKSLRQEYRTITH